MQIPDIGHVVNFENVTANIYLCPLSILTALLYRIRIHISRAANNQSVKKCSLEGVSGWQSHCLKFYHLVKQVKDNFQLKIQKPAFITVAENVVADVLKYRRDFFSKANWGGGGGGKK